MASVMILNKMEKLIRGNEAGLLFGGNLTAITGAIITMEKALALGGFILTAVGVTCTVFVAVYSIRKLKNDIANSSQIICRVCIESDIKPIKCPYKKCPFTAKKSGTATTS